MLRLLGLDANPLLTLGLGAVLLVAGLLAGVTGIAIVGAALLVFSAVGLAERRR